MGVGVRSLLLVALSALSLQAAGELRFCVHADPKTFDPLLASEEVSDILRYLTGGVLIRFNHQTQQLEPELAVSWKTLDGGRRIDFQLRRGVVFSDAAPFGPADVVATVRRLATVQSGIADAFQAAGGKITAEAKGTDGVSISFTEPVAGLAALFDQLPISPARPVAPESAVLGPFVLAEHKSGQYVLLKRNPHYWKTDSAGLRLPYLDSIRLDIQANRDTELLRFRRGELHLLDKLEPESFERLQKDMPSATVDAGASLDSEFFWFNQRPDAPIKPYKLRWFQSRAFRRALSAAVNREDIIRLVYRGRAHAAAGPVSSANRFWFNSKLTAQKFDPQAALQGLREDGFHLDAGVLHDREGNAVEFSLITNAGNKTRSQIGTLLQADLQKIGIQLNFRPIEFQSLIERITRTQDYEACLLGFSNIEPDPNSQMNVWLSSGNLHAWNPGEKSPATEWEAEIDRLMRQQHAATDPDTRKQAFDRVQSFVQEQAPVVYLVHPDVLVAISPQVRNVKPSPITPHLLGQIESVRLAAPGGGRN